MKRGARILAVADAYVAMTSDRPHRGAMSRAEAIGELREGSGNQFDPDIVTALIELTGTTNERVTSIVD